MKLQPSQKKWIYFINFSFAFLLAFMSILGPGCNGDNDPVIIICEKDGATLQLDCPAVPNTNVPFIDLDTISGHYFSNFAWNTFAALNWPALINEDTLQRGIPWLEKSFINAKHDDVLVWETFKEKREVFNTPQPTRNIPGWNETPNNNYGILRPGEDESFVPGTMAGGATPPSLIFNALDETIQVKSECLESDSLTNPFYQKIVSPRVWRGAPSNGNPVLYEVKVNYDFFDYINENKFFNQNIAKKVSRQNRPITLPYRTSAKGAAEKEKVGAKRLDKAQQAKDALANNIKLPTNQFNYKSSNALDTFRMANDNPDTSNFPPRIGAIHVKAAWIQLKDTDVHTDYHTTTAQYYTTEKGQIKKDYAVFGLVGLHIIQRIHTTDTLGGSKNAIGGTFIFSTWEHKSTETGYTYSNFLAPNSGPLGENAISGWYPHEAEPTKKTKGGIQYLNPGTYPVKRKYRVLDVVENVNKKVWKSLPKNSVWRNYRLIGTQFKALDLNAIDTTKFKIAGNPNDPTGIGQPLFLANLVIETNEGLQHFKGQAPLTYPIKRYTDSIPHHSPPNPPLVANDGPNFARGHRNMVFDGQAKNMGGCMGCHGVAQSEGYSFSFVLLGGYIGASTDSQAEFDLPPPTVYTQFSETVYPPYKKE